MSTQAMPQEVQLAIGRLFRMLMSEPSASDVADFHNCREIIMNAAESHGMKTAGPYQPNYARDRLLGAQGA
ncbi:MAG: hypothetical protein AELANPGJ_02046 [Anaerolineae bacterium]|nr:hypothetical protein [Anaerolineae bacterium]